MPTAPRTNTRPYNLSAFAHETTHTFDHTLPSIDPSVRTHGHHPRLHRDAVGAGAGGTINCDAAGAPAVVGDSDIDDQDGLRFYRSGLNFFRAITDAGAAADPAVIIIRRGLADALVHYYPVAGRIREVYSGRKLVVDCTGDGVVFVEADADDVLLSDFGDVLCPPFPCYQELLCEPDGHCAAAVGRPLASALRSGDATEVRRVRVRSADLPQHRRRGRHGAAPASDRRDVAWNARADRGAGVGERAAHGAVAAGGCHDAPASGVRRVRGQRRQPRRARRSTARAARVPLRAEGDVRPTRPRHRTNRRACLPIRHPRGFPLAAPCCRAGVRRRRRGARHVRAFVVNARGRRSRMVSPALPAGFYGNAFAFAVAACAAGRFRESTLGDVVGMVAGAKARAAAAGVLRARGEDVPRVGRGKARGGHADVAE